MIAIKNLSVGYGKNVVASNINFTINKGDYILVVGNNGSGKTTLMKTLLGLIPPLAGSIEKDNKNINKIGYLPQVQESQLNFPASVYEIVVSGNLSHLGKKFFYSNAEKELARKNIKLVGMEKYVNDNFSSLSGGQKQRVLLARALCSTRDVLLLDEPVTGLDSAATQKMYELIKQLNNDGVTIIMITHNADDAIEDATHVLQIADEPKFMKAFEYERKY